MILFEIVKEYLDNNHYDGLYSEYGCACRKSHLFEFCGYNGGPSDCTPGHNPKNLCRTCEADCLVKGEPIDAWVSEHTICGKVEENKIIKVEENKNEIR